MARLFVFKLDHPQRLLVSNDIWYKKSPLERVKWGRHFWKLVKTIPVAELVIQSYSIQTYLWLCSSGKWLPEHENSGDLYKSASPDSKQAPIHLLFIFVRKNQDRELLQQINTWPMHILVIKLSPPPPSKVQCEDTNFDCYMHSDYGEKFLLCIYIYIYIGIGIYRYRYIYV